MAQLARPIEPFGEVNVHRERDGALRVVATVLMEPDIEGARAGLALDASASMKKMYGANTPVSPLFAKAAGVVNVVEPVARTMAGYLARFAASGKVSLCYWACAADGSQIEAIGEFTDDEAALAEIRGPRKHAWGRATKLLPPVRHFVDTVFRDAPWAVGVFVTDGVVEDMAEVKAYCVDFARKISRGERKFVKLVLLGVGDEVSATQMEELDDMFHGLDIRDPKGEPIDLWDHKLVSEMRSLSEIFSEVVSENIIIYDTGVVLDDRGSVARHYSDGVPALLNFRLPADATAFTLKLGTQSFTQDLSEGLARL